MHELGRVAFSCNATISDLCNCRLLWRCGVGSEKCSPMPQYHNCSYCIPELCELVFCFGVFQSFLPNILLGCSWFFLCFQNLPGWSRYYHFKWQVLQVVKCFETALLLPALVQTRWNFWDRSLLDGCWCFFSLQNLSEWPNFFKDSSLLDRLVQTR